MHRKITTFLQHDQCVLATVGNSCNVSGYFWFNIATTLVQPRVYD